MVRKSVRDIVTKLSNSDNSQERFVGDYVQGLIDGNEDEDFISVCLEEVKSCCMSLQDDLTEE